jgi:Tol biopolymer transport system component
MTPDRDFDRQLVSWFEQRATSHVPEGLLQRSLERVHDASQRPSWRTRDGWRPPRAMGRPATAQASLGRMIAVVAVVAIALGAGLFLRMSPAAVGGPSNAPSVVPTSSTSAVPSPSAAPSASVTPAVVRTGASSWTATGSMGTARVDHTATLLRNGKVLVAGGVTVQIPLGAALASAELYDPASSSWTATGSMTSSRAGSTATLLPDGKVLVAGGYCCGLGGRSALASAELYDPISGSWTATGSMATARTGHTATLLRDGRVLVAGGGARAQGGNSWAAAEIYDPGTESWTATGSMGTPRTWHSAALQTDGKVLVQGGVDGVSAGSHTLTTAERYDPVSGTWASAAEGPVAPVEGESTALLRDGRTLLLCACTSGTASLYDPGSGAWAGAGSLITPRWSPTATLLPDGRVLVAGGTNDATALTATELFDPGDPGVSVSPGQSARPSAVPAAVIAFINFNYWPNKMAQPGRVWIVGVNGSGGRELFPGGTGDQSGVAWSPDGTQLVYSERDLVDGAYSGIHLYLTDATGSAPRAADPACGSSCYETEASFSMDGTRLVFLRSGVIATMDLATGRVVELSATAAVADERPRWSPDGKKIVFSRLDKFGNGSAVFVVDADGQNLRQLSSATLPARYPDWSPDGSRILFTSLITTSVKQGSDTLMKVSQDVYTLRPDGTDMRRLTTDGNSIGATWTPDGRILFATGGCQFNCTTSDTGSFWVMNADGNGAQLLVPGGSGLNAPFWGIDAAWQPTP